MILSVNWLKKYTSIDLPIDELASLIGERLVEIEAVIPLGEKYKDVIIAKVVECQPLEGSDHLSVTKIDDGGIVQQVERDSKGLVQVVCGASNVREGLLVAWLPPQSVVPETFGSANPFVLDSRALRGTMSHGMLASAKELDLFDDHTGILEVDVDAASGTLFSEVYELNDYLLDIENKSLTHRPDTFGVIGFARELAGIQGKRFVTPDWLEEVQPTISVTSAAQVVIPRVSIDNPEVSKRFQALVLSDVKESAVSPVLIQSYLARCGVRPVNALVDVSNYLMLLTGQPTHAYDYDKVQAIAGDDFTLRVRLARPQESLELLDGKTIELDETDIVIAAGTTAVGLAGVMGGKSTAVDANTKTVIFEVATFDLYRMRSTQMRHGIFSEAVTRFTKGIPMLLGSPVAAKAAEMLSELAGAAVVSDLLEACPAPYEPITVTVSEGMINDTLGTNYSAGDITDLLENVGFTVRFEQLVAHVQVPYWRKDIALPEDIIEEVGRLAGFDTINPVLPYRPFDAIHPEPIDELRDAIRSRLVRAGANEVLTYSFVHADVFKKVGQNPDNAYKIVNSISPELQYYRQSLTPSLLSHVFANSKAGYDSFALFELNKVHEKAWGLTDEKVPVEQNRLSLVVAHAKKTGSAYYQAKRLLEFTLNGLGIACAFRPLEHESAIDAPYQPRRSALVVELHSGKLLGVVGEFTKSAQKSWKLPAYAAGFEVDVDQILELHQEVAPAYKALSRYPGTERDICFQVGSEISYATIVDAAQRALEGSELLYEIRPVDIYHADDEAVKNITIRIMLGSYEKTMTNEEVAQIMNQLTRVVIDATDGKVI